MAIVVKKRPYERNWSGNPIAYELHSSAAAADATIYFDIKLMFKYIGGSYAEVVSLPYNPVNGTAIVNVEGLLHSILKYGLPKLQADEKLTTTTDKQTGYFFIAFREVSGVAGGFDNSEILFPRFVIKGGMSIMKWRGNNYWYNYFDPRKPFLTWQKSGRLAGPTERIYLAWLNHTNISGFTLKARIVVYFTDGGFTRTFDIELTDTAPDKISFIPCGYTQLDLAILDPDRTVYYWEIKIMDHTDIGAPADVSEIFTYYLDNRKDYNSTTLNYRNSLGGIDSARVRGVIEKKLDFENEILETVTDPDYFNGDTVLPALNMINSRETSVYKGDIGYLPKEDQERFRDMHLQRQMWWEVDKKWIPIINVTGAFSQNKSDDKLWNFPIEWMPAIPGDYFYTPPLAETGDSEASSNVCDGLITGCAIDITINATDADIDFYPLFSGSATKFTYQVIGFHSDPIEIPNTPGPVHVSGLTLDHNYSLQLRAICADGSKGQILNRPFVTAFTVYDSSIYNYGDHSEDFDILINDVSAHTSSLDIDEFDLFNCGATGVNNVKVTWVNDGYTSSKLICNAGTYFGVITGSQVTWDAIDITGGFSIEMY